ncbi:acetamidase/formamidase family protein [Streptomyces sp. MBT65]|uniref:acetamidase/formamidase family protein n=1 Tax=Streptomyces sp. MBT65 TaxID=1488395 RepID=UPI00190CF69A|nr:acetamidase/formamidase family protein [Streptomyces sp. MBT65]MBK3580064.1 acetamidase/formamidase family protein [Streptomyces sp. MBT65]
MSHHSVPKRVHRLWSTEHEPVLEVEEGDTVSFDLTEATDGQFDPGSTVDAVAGFDWDRVYPLAGPIVVRDAEPGDVLEVEFLELRSVDWGWTAVLPGLGLLTEDFPDAHLHLWDLSGGDTANFLDVADIPIRPFCGVVGVCPDTAEPQSVLPPGHFGGNVDCKDLVVGTRLHLPVQVPGARLGLGHPHAAQGDGELCVSAIEASLSGTARIRLHKGRRIPAPQFETTGPLRTDADRAGHYATMGVAPDLVRAAQDATRAMIDHLGTRYGLAPIDAYVLCSVAVDLRITEVVDASNWVVSAYLPEAILHTS